ncbi:hypothetical protein V8G54_000227 (mitochondrion) [Vigna mungo]|uniref:Uncharacterized protein n=2 Tax=Phaseoleae TaxID=163735 RepID=A0AAQ3SGT3_VIGMU
MHGTSRPCLRGTVERATHECCRVGRANNSNAFGEKIVKFPTETTLSTDPPRAGHTSSVRLSRGGNRTTGKDPADLPRARGRALFQREWGLGRGKESKPMDINEPSLMDVAHDTINSTQGPALIEVAYSPSSEGKRQGFFRSNSGRVS